MNNLEKQHYKMYKAGKHWMFATVTTLTLTGGIWLGQQTIQADTTEANSAVATSEEATKLTTDAEPAQANEPATEQQSTATAAHSMTDTTPVPTKADAGDANLSNTPPQQAESEQPAVSTQETNQLPATNDANATKPSPEQASAEPTATVHDEKPTEAATETTPAPSAATSPVVSLAATPSEPTTGTWGTAHWTFDGETLTFDQGGILGSGLNRGEIDNFRDQVKYINFAAKVEAPHDSSMLLANFSNLIKFDNMHNLNTSQVTNMYGMFFSNISLESLDLSTFDTQKVTTIQYMFRDVRKVTSLDLSSFNTSKVVSMRSMFGMMSSLTSVNVSSFDTSNVVDMSGMFFVNNSLETLDLSNFNTSRVTTMQEMFWSDYSLKKLDLSNFDSTRAIRQSMFSGTSSLSQLRIGVNTDLSNSSMATPFVNETFEYDGQLRKVAYSNWVNMDSPSYQTSETPTNSFPGNWVWNYGLVNQQSITGHDVQIYTGATVSNDPATYGAKASDKDGKEIPVTVDTSQVDNQKPGTYDVTLTTADGQTKIVQVTVLANQQSITGHDVQIYTGTTVSNDPATYGAKATDKDGNEIAVTVDTSQVDNQKPGTYDVTLSTSDGQKKVVQVTVLQNQQSITGQDVKIYTGEVVSNDPATYGAKATDKDGNEIPVTVDTSQVDNQKPGTYDVTLTTADGQTKIVQVTMLANQQGLTGDDITISVGDEVPTSPSDYGARATDRDGKDLLITVDTSRVNPQQVGIYPVVLTASDGQTVTVFVHVRAVLTPEGVDEQPTTDDHHPVGESENQKQGAERELLKPPYEQPEPKVGRATSVQHPQSAPAKPAQQGEKASALLPKTGEHTTTLMAVLGFALLGLIGRFVYKRRKH